MRLDSILVSVTNIKLTKTDTSFLVLHWDTYYYSSLSYNKNSI